MKKAKQEIMRIFLILIIQVLISFLFSNLLNIKWIFKELICNYVFVVFWCSYIICILGIGIVKKITRNRDKRNLI
mgnify:FL=1